MRDASGHPSPRPIPQRASSAQVPVLDDPLARPDRARPPALDEPLEHRPQRLRHHIRRPPPQHPANSACRRRIVDDDDVRPYLPIVPGGRQESATEQQVWCLVAPDSVADPCRQTASGRRRSRRAWNPAAHAAPDVGSVTPAARPRRPPLRVPAAPLGHLVAKSAGSMPCGEAPPL